jgi:hypothetical protein
MVEQEPQQYTQEQRSKDIKRVSTTHHQKLSLLAVGDGRQYTASNTGRNSSHTISAYEASSTQKRHMMSLTR